MEMNLAKFKHIVTSGCSYGVMPESISVWNGDGTDNENNDLLKKKLLIDNRNVNLLSSQNKLTPHFELVGDDVIIWNFSLPSQSSDWIADTTETALSFLIKKNIPSENIFVFCEWTQWDRVSVDVFDWLKMEDIDFNIEKERLQSGFGIKDPIHLKNGIVSQQFKYEKDLIEYKKEIGIKAANGNIGKINERFYLTAGHTSDETFDTEKGKKWSEVAVKIEQAMSDETKINNYLNNIIRTQNLCKLHDIKYNFAFMQESLSGWKRSSDSNILYHIHDNYNYRFMLTSDSSDVLYKNLEYGPIANSTTNIENVYKSSQNKINQIDFKNIWFYKNEKFERGGIDEWAIDTFGHGCMLSGGHVNNVLNEKEILAHEVVTTLDGHPHLVFYKLLWNQVAFNCNFFKINKRYQKVLTKLILEDLNHTDITKHNILISKKHLNKILPVIDVTYDSFRKILKNLS